MPKIVPFPHHARAFSGSDSKASGPVQSSAVTTPSVSTLIAFTAPQSGRTNRRRQRLTVALSRPTDAATSSSDIPCAVMKSDRCMPGNVRQMHNGGQAECTPDVVYTDLTGVHPMHMATATARQRASKRKEKPLRWRVTCMRHWRLHKDQMTLEEAAEALGRAPYNISTTHATLGRYENGKVMPPIGVVEALAALYGTDIDSLLNRLPTIPAKRETVPSSIADAWNKANPDERERLVRVVKAAVGSN